MPDIRFQCDSCQHAIVADVSASGSTMSCPHCRKTLKVPADDPTLPPISKAMPALTAEVAVDLPQIEGYEILAKLGEGGMGAVYRARQPLLNRIVALKVMARRYSDDPTFVARFVREAAAAANLSHPNMVQVFAAGEASKTRFIAMEFVEGRTLSQHIRKHGRLDAREAVAVTTYVAQALQHAWNKARLIHRDIKPENIFLSYGGEVKVGDLGLAKSVDETDTVLTTTGMTMGSPHYISPEQVRATKDLDFRADIYSLGCTLYHMLTGRPPFDAEDSFSIMTKHVNDAPPSISEAWPQCPPPLAALLGKMLAKDRNARPASYEKLIEELLEAHGKLKLSSTPAVVNPISPIELTRSFGARPAATPPHKRARMRIVVTGAVLTAALAALWFWSTQGNTGIKDEEAARAVVGGQPLEERNTIMKRILGWLLLSSATTFAGDLTTLDGTTYRNYKVTRIEADGLVITHSTGAGKVEFLNLPEDVRKKYGFDTAKAEAAKKAAGGGTWQEMDQRLVFLTIQLASVETSLAALNRALIGLGIHQANQQRVAASAQQANEVMDRNAGGPVPWSDFYGRAAQKFFYHPVDMHSSYHTVTVLSQQSPSWDVASKQGVPSRQGLPVHQRPPQFDYIYRANSEAEKRAQAEVARLGNNAAAIQERRRQLEAEQAALWCKISFRAVTGRELLSTPLYRSELKPSGTDTLGRQRMETLRAAMDFLRGNHRLLEQVPQNVDSDPAGSYRQLQNGVATARAELDGRLTVQPTAAGDVSNRQTAIGKLAAVAKRMVAVTENIADAHRLALDGDTAGDQGRKATFRSQLQQSLVLYAESLLAGDECVNELARDWNALPGTQPVATASATGQSSPVVPMAKPSETPVAGSALAANMGGAAVTISCSEAVRILPLEVGQPTLYNAAGSKPITGINPELSGWQFVSIPWHTINAYEIRVNKDGVLYAFGGGNNHRKLRDFLGTEEIGKWETADGAINGISVHKCLRRKVTAGETIKLRGMELQLAARRIELVHDGKVEPSADVAADGFSPLFNGRDLAGWTPMEATDGEGDNHKPSSGGWIVRDGNLVCDTGTGGWLRSERQYGDFVLQLEFKLRSDANSGICIRNAGLEHQAGMEIQIADSSRQRKAKPEMITGAIYKVVGLRNPPLRSIGEWNSMEIRCEGDNIEVRLNGTRTASANMSQTPALKDHLRSGYICISNWQGMAKGMSFRNIRIKELSPSSLLAPASKAVGAQSVVQSGEPFTNSLGMKFVPVAGTSVQFSIWATRYQDYEAFVAATGRSWNRQPPFKQAKVKPGPTPQGPTHPVVQITWDDAKAFCAWLTEKERRAGILSATQEYRLPTDAEWSIAVGLGNEAGSTPRERGARIAGVYPWGTQWPPPAGAGNYNPDLRVDDFTYTSPVGSFPANRFGLYDMGGNVWQWCEDFYDGQSGKRVLRGAGWLSPNATELLSSARRANKPDSLHHFECGFRCVLAGGGGTASR